MNKSRIAQDIEGQPQSLMRVLNQQAGEGLGALLKAASMLRTGKRVIITGIGASMFASIPLEYSLCARGIDASVIEAAELLYYRHQAAKDAILIIVSRSGESIEIKRLLELFGGQRIIIGVTNEPDSLLARNANVVLNIGSLPDEYVAIQTYTGTLLTLYILDQLLDRSIGSITSELNDVLNQFAPVVSSSLEAMEQWSNFFELHSSVYCLARGASYASALEGALLFNEIAKIPARAMAIASFRHGPVEVVDKNFRGLIFAPEGLTRELNLALAQDVVHFGADVRIIGPRGNSGLQGSWLPAVPESLAPLFEIIPLQVAALGMAILQGVKPGTFRYAPQVAVDEARFHLT